MSVGFCVLYPHVKKTKFELASCGRELDSFFVNLVMLWGYRSDSRSVRIVSLELLTSDCISTDVRIIEKTAQLCQVTLTICFFYESSMPERFRGSTKSMNCCGNSTNQTCTSQDPLSSIALTAWFGTFRMVGDKEKFLSFLMKLRLFLCGTSKFGILPLQNFWILRWRITCIVQYQVTGYFLQACIQFKINADC